MKTEKVLLGLSAELREAIDDARGDVPRGSYVEALLWNTAAIKQAAKRVGISKPKRAEDRRGRWKRNGGADQ